MLEAWCLWLVSIGHIDARQFVAPCLSLGACRLELVSIGHIDARQFVAPSVFAICYILNVAVPACTAVQALVALLGCGTALILRDYSTSPGPAARRSSVDLGA